MSNQIRVSTQWLQDCARQLQGVQSAIENTANKLANIDMDEESGGNKRLSYSLRLRSSGGSYRGSNAREAVRASARGLQALAREVERSCEALRRNADSFEDVEQLVHALFTAVGAGDAAGQVGKSGEDTGFADYIRKYQNADEILDQNRAAWEAEDDFIDTEYNRQLLERLRNLLLYDPAMSPEAWEVCTTDAEREAFLRNVCDKLQQVYGTELAHGKIYFAYDEDFPVESKGFLGFGQKRAEYFMLDIGDGKTVKVLDRVRGCYYSDEDVMVIHMDNIETYDEVIGVLCHENRHNMQVEIMDADDLSKYAEAGSEDYARVLESQKEWRNDRDYYFSTNDALVDARVRQIRREMPSWQEKQYSDAQIRYMAELDLYEVYSAQQIEVDARYVQEYAVDCMQDRRMIEIVETVAKGANDRNYEPVDYGPGDKLLRDI